MEDQNQFEDPSKIKLDDFNTSGDQNGRSPMEGEDNKSVSDLSGISGEKDKSPKSPDQDEYSPSNQDFVHEGNLEEDEIKEEGRVIKQNESGVEEDMNYEKQEQDIISYCKINNCLWTDKDFPPDNRSLYKNIAKIPEWARDIRTIKWLRPHEIVKDAKFIVDKEADLKQGAFGESWFIGAVVMIGTKKEMLEKLIVSSEYFQNYGFVAFQFFKNGEWKQVIVDTFLPFDPDSKQILFSQCSTPNEFWLPLIEKAYCKLHGSYEMICEGSIVEGLVDLTGGVAEGWQLNDSEVQKMIENDQMWNMLLNYFHQKFFIGCSNTIEGKGTKNADTGPHGILENHYYAVIDIREFPKEKLRLVRIRNVWGPEGGWNGAFCDDSEEWDKHRNLREELKLVLKSKKSDGTWWMSYQDWCIHFNRTFIAKVFPEAWESYSIMSKWNGKSNGGVCPQRMKWETDIPEYLQLDTDEKWFNNPQFRIKVTKETKVYLSLMQEDEKIVDTKYIQCNFMVVVNKVKGIRVWERPQVQEVVIEANPNGDVPAQREITQYLTLKRFEGKNYGYYIIIPNMILPEGKKEEKRNFILRVFSSDPIELVELPETLEISMEGAWGDNSAGGKRKFDSGKDNPAWCKNPQYFLNLQQPTHLKIILRKIGNLRRAKGLKVGLTICRFDNQNNKPKKEVNLPKNTKAGGSNLVRLLAQTSQQLEPPIMENIERKLTIKVQEKFKESTYYSEEIGALYFYFNPTEGPFIIVPSLDQEDKPANYRLTIFSNNPVQLQKLDENYNDVVIGKWEQDISDGGCHLYEDPFEKDMSKRTWTLNPKFLVTFKDCNGTAKLKVTLMIAEKNWKSKTKNTVGGMIGLYLIEKREGKIAVDQIFREPNFIPIECITEEYELKEISRNGYYIMPATYQCKIHGSFILAVQADKEMTLQAIK